jgi:dolichol-phosphate mannosyltransferase
MPWTGLRQDTHEDPASLAHRETYTRTPATLYRTEPPPSPFPPSETRSSDITQPANTTLMTKPELLVVMPVYNEQAIVRKTVMEWFHEIENWTEDFVLLAINDGSTDGTRNVLERLQRQLGARIEILDQPNRGHGQSCIEGYRIAAERNIPFVFQIDSDGQCDPQYFFRLWRERLTHDVVYGRRTRRADGLRRTLVSWVLRAVLLFGFGVNCVDPNVPYRLMRTAAIAPLLETIPRDFALANVALAMLLRKRRGVSHASIAIHFRERYGGEPTVPFARFGAEAIKLYHQVSRMLRATRTAISN